MMQRSRWIRHRPAGPVVVIALLVAMLAMAADAAAADARTWIVGATVISAERADDGSRLDVLIEGDRIAAVTRQMAPDAGQGATIVDAAGAYLVPGLIDGHVHVQSVPGFTPPIAGSQRRMTQQYRAQQPRSFLRHGFTTLIDLVSTDLEVLQEFRSTPLHPDLYHCGAMPVADGYPSHFAPGMMRESLFRYTVTEPGPGGRAQARSPAAVVEQIRRDGGICVKTFHERGFGRDHDLPVPSAALFAQIVLAAHAARLPVLLHASSLDAQRFGVQGGADILAHGLWNWGASDGPDTLPGPVTALLDDIVSRRIGYMPTLQVLAGMRVLFDPDFPAQAGMRRVIPPELLRWYQTSDGQWFRKDLADGRSDDQMRARLDAVLKRGALTTGYLAQKGARFLFGSDTPSGPTPGNPPGLNGYQEMQRLVGAGMSLRQLFEAATINNAQAFGLAGQVGTIEVGKKANLLLLERSPLQSVEAYDTPRRVWVGGRGIDPASLDADR